MNKRIFCIAVIAAAALAVRAEWLIDFTNEQRSEYYEAFRTHARFSPTGMRRSDFTTGRKVKKFPVSQEAINTFYTNRVMTLGIGEAYKIKWMKTHNGATDAAFAEWLVLDLAGREEWQAKWDEEHKN